MLGEDIAGRKRIGDRVQGIGARERQGQRQKKKRIPRGNDRKKSNSNGRLVSGGGVGGPRG